jgi:hypothetical protein
MSQSFYSEVSEHSADYSMYERVTDRVPVCLPVRVSLSWYQEKTKIGLISFHKRTFVREVQTGPVSAADLSNV